MFKTAVSAWCFGLNRAEDLGVLHGKKGAMGSSRRSKSEIGVFGVSKSKTSQAHSFAF